MTTPASRPQQPGLARPLALLLALLPCGLAAEDQGPPSAAVVSANALVAHGKTEEAITLLEAWCKDHPDDHLAAHTLLADKVALKEKQIEVLIAEQALTKGIITGDIDYEKAKARASKEVQARLAWPEYYLAQKQYGDAAALCNAILHDYPNQEAVLCLKYRILEVLVSREREDLLHDRQYGHDAGINQVIREGTFPANERPPVPRTEWIFAEDIEAAERAKVEEKLEQKVNALIYDGTNGTQSAQVRELLTTLFAYTGINYVLLDDAIGNDRLTIHLIDVSVGDALATIAKLVKVRFNYSGNTVYVTNVDSEVMETRIIRLRSGLTDVDTELQPESLDASVPGANGGGGAGGQGGIGSPLGPNGQPQQPAGNRPRNGQGGQQGNKEKSNSDLERLLDKAPDLIVGWPTDAKMYLDRKSNTLYIRSTPSTISELERLLSSLDYNNVQVLIEARFLDVTETAQRELGVDWEGGGTRGPLSIGGQGLVGAGGAPNPGASGATINGTAASLPGVPVPPTQGLFATALFNRGASIAASITALEQKGQADTLSNPKILTLNNSVGVIEVAQNINYVSSYNAQATSQTTTVSNGIAIPSSTEALTPQVSTTDVGIKLRIKPSIARNSDIITLTIQPVVKELVRFDNFPVTFPSGTTAPNITENENFPVIDTRSLVATLHVHNGQVVALGGLTKESENSATAGVPFFSRIPFLGQLFRHDSKASNRDNLMILVTASIITPDGLKESDEVQRMQDSAKVLLPPASLDALVGTNPNGQPPSQLPVKPGR